MSSPPASASDVKHAATIMSNDNDTIGGDYPRSALKRGREGFVRGQLAEIRPIDVTMESIEKRFAKEFSVAEERIMKKKADGTTRFLSNYMERVNYRSNPSFMEWMENKKIAKEGLHIHYLDELLDTFANVRRRCLQLWSSVGLCVGAVRAVYLWKKTDRNYAKLNGVTFTSIAMWEGSIGFLRGALLGLLCAIAVMCGDELARSIVCLFGGTVARPRRNWFNITLAGTCGGAISAAGLCVWMRRYFSFPVRIGISSSVAVAAACASHYVAMAIYQPHVDQFPFDYDTPDFIPWQYRTIKQVGPPGVRGRYI